VVSAKRAFFQRVPCDDRTFPALFEEKEPFLPKKNEKTSTSLRNRETNAILLFLLRQKGVFDFSSFFFFFNREVFLDDSSFAHSLSLLLFSKLFSSKRVNGVES
jgi:hypothetical protein